MIGIYLLKEISVRILVTTIIRLFALDFSDVLVYLAFDLINLHLILIQLYMYVKLVSS